MLMILIHTKICLLEATKTQAQEGTQQIEMSGVKKVNKNVLNDVLTVRRVLDGCVDCFVSL